MSLGSLVNIIFYYISLYLFNNIRPLVIVLIYFYLIKNEFMLSSASLPMVCPPNKWSNSDYGGYLNNLNMKDSIVTGSKQHNHKMENKESLFECVNKLNNIQYKYFYIINVFIKYKNSLIYILNIELDFNNN